MVIQEVMCMCDYDLRSYVLRVSFLNRDGTLVFLSLGQSWLKDRAVNALAPAPVHLLRVVDLESSGG